MANTAVTFGASGYVPITNFDLQQLAGPPRALLGPRTNAGIPGIDQEQFMLFRVGDEKEALIDLTKVDPTIVGSDEKPDIDAAVNLLAFHFDENVTSNISDKMRATLRFDLGKDEASTSPLEPLFWSIAAGLDLYEHATKGSNAAEPKKMNDNFANTFKRRPIEIPGGLGQLRFEVIVHEEPKWWQQILHFGQSETAKRLVSSLGFPGIALDAMRLIDEMVSRFTDAAAKPLIKSRPLTLAFSRYARDEYTGGDSRTVIGCVGNGTYVLTRYTDVSVFQKNPPLFLGSTGMLVPKQNWEAEGLNFNYSANPYNKTTYGVVRIRTFERRIQVS
ncbi:MAG: hypothetical protein ABSD74_17925 [Rhizomicrobium sp.]|jgi:hypothetical protein